MGTHGQEPDPDRPGQAWPQPQGPTPAPGIAPFHTRAPGWLTPPPGGGALPPSPYGPDPQTPKRRRTGLIIGSCIAAAIVLIAVGMLSAAVVNGKGGTRSRGGASPSRSAASHTIMAPVSVAGYTRTTGNVTKRLAAAMRKQAENGAATVSHAWAEAYAVAKIGIYTRAGATSRLIFIGFSVTGTPQVASILRSQPPSEGLDSFFLGAGVPNANDFPPGPLGGVLRCGVRTSATVPVTMCAWDDSSVLALVAEPGALESRLARVALAFRGAAEH